MASTRPVCHMGHMKQVTIRKLHEETGRIVDQAENGESIVIARRGVPVAELRPITPRPRVRVPDLAKRYAKFPRVKSDSGRFQEEDRR